MPIYRIFRDGEGKHRLTNDPRALLDVVEEFTSFCLCGAKIYFHEYFLDDEEYTLPAGGCKVKGCTRKT
jgi:hypothetical protein